MCMMCVTMQAAYKYMQEAMSLFIFILNTQAKLMFLSEHMLNTYRGATQIGRTMYEDKKNTDLAIGK